MQVFLWYPLSLITGGTTAKIMVAAKDNFLGKYIYKDTIARNLAAVIYKVRYFLWPWYAFYNFRDLLVANLMGKLYDDSGAFSFHFLWAWFNSWSIRFFTLFWFLVSSDARCWLIQTVSSDAISGLSVKIACSISILDSIIFLLVMDDGCWNFQHWLHCDPLCSL